MAGPESVKEIQEKAAKMAAVRASHKLVYSKVESVQCIDLLQEAVRARKEPRKRKVGIYEFYMNEESKKQQNGEKK